MIKFIYKLLLISLSLIASAQASNKDLISNSLAIHQVETLRQLELKGFSIGALLSGDARIGRLSNQELLKYSSYNSFVNDIAKEVEVFRTNNAGLGTFFSMKFLKSANTRFVLVGVVNRMDRAYVDAGTCGEVRFIYRLSYSVQSNGKSVFSRLPVTLNVIYKPKLEGDVNRCRLIAQSWKTLDKDGSLENILRTGPLSAENFKNQYFDRLEVNLQIVRSGAAAQGDFGGHAEYLLKAYKMNAGKTLEASYLENQIDREKLSTDSKLLADFKVWLLKKDNLEATDKGTLLIPDRFLAKVAYSLAPGGIARSKNRMLYGLVKEPDFASVDFKSYENIKSAAGVIRRLNESSCTGCHQTRAIGGFHFTGRDPFDKYPGNSVFLPGSPHFLGEMLRRSELLEKVADADNAKNGVKALDYARGFAARPSDKYASVLDGSGVYNGWGSHCAVGNDPSFKSWTCAQGLQCKQLHDVSDKTGMGICIGEEGRQQVGDPCEFGTVSNSGFGKDKFHRFPVKYSVHLPNAMCSPQSQLPGTKTGGFLHGSVRKKSCEDGPGEAGLPSEAACGPLPAAGPGFNACIGKKNFDECLRQFSTGVGMRGCDQLNPCRDDYICAESFTETRGVCVPPYFLFQFRVDGHPSEGFN